ncbi:DNA-directed RNA polymerase subunit omega [Clostridiaceae bacterium NSJ-31]|uniref:DNA-directed RNA polymerase subunit omega n=2 Tax=Ligaoa zhengdingensis TaxID=2763658 RepID=A0A926I5J5_9FIRM|nr:DNA-directed RNA polymerase subunit omega [Ligaoa zhengdingensis]MBC8547535.1 DNA-directed RNA polymerase subunit omega [Ligaoa zhengdingensis]
MLRPAVNEILKNGESPYSLVVGVAKRARQITDESEEERKILVDKPVKLAVEEFAEGKVKLVEAEDIGKDVEE